MEIIIKDGLHQDPKWLTIFEVYANSSIAVGAFQGRPECGPMLDAPKLPEWQKRRQQSA